MLDVLNETVQELKKADSGDKYASVSVRTLKKSINFEAINVTEEELRSTLSTYETIRYISSSLNDRASRFRKTPQ